MKQMTFYEKYIKRGFDVVLSGLGAVMLLPVFAVTAAAIFIEDPGPVIFKQKRVGLKGRKLVEDKFSRQIVVDQYMKDIREFIK